MVPGSLCPPIIWSFIVGGYMKLYLIAGYANSGKNYFAEMMKEELERLGKRVCILKITSPLYHYAYDYFGWNGKEEDKPRSFLQQMGIEYIKEELHMPDFLLNRLFEDIHILDKFFDVGIITDGRLLEEITKLKTKYPSLVTIHLVRKDYDASLTEKEKRHITEQDLKQYYDFDFEVLNCNDESLKMEAFRIVEEGESKNE